MQFHLGFCVLPALPYRLVVSTRSGATQFCIGASDDDEALIKADRILACLDLIEAEVSVTCGALPVLRLKPSAELASGSTEAAA